LKFSRIHSPQTHWDGIQFCHFFWTQFKVKDL
jgi:hypothetical protein